MKTSQKWFNKKYSETIETLIELKISDKVFDKFLRIDGFTKLKTIDLKKLKLTSLEISNCSHRTEISLSEIAKYEINKKHSSFNLKISKRSERNEVKFSKCQIENLSVSECPKLKKLGGL